MPRYFSRPKAKVRSEHYWSEDIPRPSTLEVCDHEPTYTGLLDVHGNGIWRAPPPMGFVWEEDQ